MQVHKWLGRKFVAGEYECAHFAADVLEEGFGFAPPRLKPGSTVRAKDKQVMELAAAHQFQRVGSPSDGDLVLMRDPRGVSIASWHVGVWVDEGVLHLPTDGMSIHEPMSRIRSRWTFHGWYKCPR